MRNRLRLQLVLEFAVDAMAALVATLAVLILLDWSFRLGLQARIALLVLSVAGVVGFLGVRAVRRWRSAGLDELSLAMTLDRFRPGIGHRIADVLQLPGLLDESGASASVAMVRLAVVQALRLAGGIRLASTLEPRADHRACRGVVVAWLVPVVFATVAPDAARLSFDRWLRGSNERWPQSDISQRDGPHARRAARRPSRRAVLARSPLRSADAGSSRRGAGSSAVGASRCHCVASRWGRSFRGP